MSLAANTALGGSMGPIPPPAMYQPPASFETPKFQSHNHTGSSCCGGGGGAYDLRNSEEAAQISEDFNACLAISLGTRSYTASIFLNEKGTFSVTGKAPLPLTVFLDRKSGLKSLKKWYKSESRANEFPKNVFLGAKGGENFHENYLRLRAGLNLLIAKNNENALLLEKSFADENVRVNKSSDAKHVEDSSGVSFELSEGNDGKVWENCEVEYILALLLISIKLKVEAAFKVKCVTCSFSVPDWMDEPSRVCLQKSIFLAEMVPAFFISSNLSSAIGCLYSEERGLMKSIQKENFVLCFKVGANYASASLLKEGKESILEVEKSAGEWGFGGENMDALLADKIKADFEGFCGSPFPSKYLPCLLEEVKRGREELSHSDKTTFSLEKFGSGDDSFKTFEREMSKKEFERFIEPFLSKYDEMVSKVSEDLDKNFVPVIYLGGGVGRNFPGLSLKLNERFPSSKIEKFEASSSSNGAALLLASRRSLIWNVEANDKIHAQIDIVRSEDSSTYQTLFPTFTSFPSAKRVVFDRKGPNSGNNLNLKVVQNDRCAKFEVFDLGDPFVQYDESGYPSTATVVCYEFRVDSCGVFSCEVLESEFPARKNKRMRRVLNALTFVVAVAAVLFGGYFKLKELAEKPERDMNDARVRLTKFYEAVNPSKLPTVEETIKRYAGRYEVLFKRLESRYDLSA